VFVTLDVETKKASTKVFRPAESSKLQTTTASAKPIHHIAKEKPPLATLHSLHTNSNIPDNLSDKLHTGVDDDDQSDDLNQLIDFIVGSTLFSYSEIAHLCLTPQQERIKILMVILAKIKESQGIYSSICMCNCSVLLV